MTTVAKVAIHGSQFPDQVMKDLLESLRARQVNHKFHYDSVKQTQKWLALHRSYSPTRTDADCAAVYEQSFAAAAAQMPAANINVVGLGCGGGQKDTRLITLLMGQGRVVGYAPCDVSVSMTVVARQTALAVIPPERCLPIVFDLASATDLPEVFDQFLDPAIPRLFTFFGMIPNFEPDVILPKLASLVRRQDWLLFSANLAPGADYDAGVRQILPQYDNELTRDWLLTVLFDLGVKPDDGALHFRVETEVASGLKRVAAVYIFQKSCRFKIDSNIFDVGPGDTMRLFFSYRYTPHRVRAALARHKLAVSEEWAAPSGEEGVFLCRVQ